MSTDDPVKKAHDLENRVREKSLKKQIEDSNTPKDILLPEWPESKRGTPNSFLRSALFSATDCKKERTSLKDAVLASQGGVVIRYTGEQLNQEDLTLWETLVHLAKKHPLGYVCEFTAYEILKAMKLPTNGEQYERLDRGIDRLSNAVPKIIHDDKSFWGSLIASGAKDIKTQLYKIKLSDELIKLYSESTWIDVDQRLRLKRKSLAQYLHGYYSSHKAPYPVKVETLHQLSGSRIKRLAKFKENLKAALDELVKIDFLESYKIDNELVSVKRK